MTQTINDDVLINGNLVIDGIEDIEQLRVQGHSTQDEPLQTWETSTGEVLSQITGDGRVQVGDDFATPDALIEAQRDDDPGDVSSKAKRGIHSLGRIVNLITDVISWAVAELELIGSNGVSGLQTAFRAKLTHNNTGDSTDAELRAGDFEGINQTGTVTEPVGQMAGLRGTLTNEADAYLDEAAGVEARLVNTGTLNEAALFDAKPVENDGDIGILYGLRIPDIVEGTTGNYGIQTGRGPVEFGDVATAEAYKLGAAQAVTIALGAVALVTSPVTKGYYRVSAEGTPSTTIDDLASLTGGTGNMLVALQAASGHTITVKHGTGNIYFNGETDFVLSGDKTLLLFYDGTNWSDLGAGGGLNTEAVDDRVAALLVEGTNVDLTYNDSANTLTVAVPNENIDDRVAAFLQAGGGLTLDYDDINSLLTIFTDLPRICDGRLTLESGVPIPVSDQTAKTTLYFTPYKGKKISLYNGTRWKLYDFAECSLALSGLSANTDYDIYIYDNAGTLTLEAVAWNAPDTATISSISNANPPVVTTSAAHPFTTGQLVTQTGNSVGANNGTFRIGTTTSTTYQMLTLAGGNPGAPGSVGTGGTAQRADQNKTRATALGAQDGIYVKSGAATHRYLGTIHITRTAGQCEDSLTSRLVWNYYNRVQRQLYVIESANSWTYDPATYRPANNNVANRVLLVQGIAETLLNLDLIALGGGDANIASIGEDSTNTAASNVLGQRAHEATSGGFIPLIAKLSKIPSVGLHFYQWLERGTGNTHLPTRYGDNGNSAITQSGMTGTWEC